MGKTSLLFGLCVLASTMLSHSAEEPEVAEMAPETVLSESSYGIGYQVARQFLSDFAQVGMDEEDVDIEAFVEGIKRGLTGEDLSEEEEERIITAMQGFEKILEVKMEEAMAEQQAMAAENLAKGAAFLEENAARDEVVVTESGLQYEVLEAGEGEPYQGDGTDSPTFLLSYKGSLIDGTEFDASPEGQDVPMGLQVIDGFREALMMMPEGASWRIFIPADLAYGEQGAGGVIPPNAVLIFEIGLTEIVIPEEGE